MFELLRCEIKSLLENAEGLKLVEQANRQKFYCHREIKNTYNDLRNHAKEYAMFAIPSLLNDLNKESALREVEDHRRRICECVQKIKIVEGASNSVSE